MLVLVGGLNNIRLYLYEAASIDGSSRWHTFWTITLPLMRRAMLFVVVLATVNAFKIFIPVYVITWWTCQKAPRPGLLYLADRFLPILSSLCFCLSIILLIILGILAAAQFYLLRSDVEY